MSALEDKTYELIIDKIIDTAKDKYKKLLLLNNVEKSINHVFMKFESSSCVSLDFKELADYIIGRMTEIYNIYTDLNSNYEANIESFKSQVNSKYSSLPKEDLNFVNNVVNSVLSSVEWIVNNGLSEDAKIIINRLNANKTKQEPIPNRFQDLLDGIENPDNSHALFSYDHDDIFIGRDRELDRLQMFFDDERPLLFWVVCGPGGSGKNKLVYHYFRSKERHKHWFVRFVESIYIEAFLELNSWDCNKDTCLIIDDAEVDYASLRKWFIRLFSFSQNRNHKLRIILLARGYENEINPSIEAIGHNSSSNPDDIYYPEWFKDIIHSSISIKNKMFDEEFLYLPEFGRKEVLELVRSYYFERCSREIPESELKIIETNIYSNKPCILRPLFILVITELYITKPTSLNKSFDISDVCEHLYQRYRDDWLERIGDDVVFDAMLSLYAYATLTDGWNVDNDKLPEFLQGITKILDSKNRVSRANYYAKVFEIITCTKSNGKQLSKCVPDIFGEYFVLKLWADLHDDDEFDKWMKTILLNKSSVHFVCKAIGDFYNSHLLRNVVTKLILRLMTIMETSEEHVFTAKIVSCYFSLSTVTSNLSVYLALTHMVDSLKYHYCWLEVYVAYILNINNNQALSYLESCYPIVIALSTSWDLRDNSRLASKVITLMSELVRHYLAKYSSSESRVVKNTLIQYMMDYKTVALESNADDSDVKEALIVAESRMLEKVYSLRSSKLNNIPSLLEFAIELENNIVSYFDYYISNTSCDSNLIKLIECVGRMLSNPCRNKICNQESVFDRLFICIEQADDPRVFWVGIPTLIRISIARCADHQRGAKKFVENTFTHIKNCLIRVKDLKLEKDNSLLSYHITSSVQRFFDYDLIAEKYKEIARKALYS